MIRKAIWTARAQSQSLDEQSVAKDPIDQFRDWYGQVKKSKLLPFPNGMNLSTVNSEGIPSSRVVLLKDFTHAGFVFYTNYTSQKGEEIAANPNVSANFYWPFFERQVRITGKLVKVSPSTSDAYFHKRERGSQTGAWASQQSREVSSRKEMKERFQQIDRQYQGKPVPRPPHWGGFFLRPNRIEFWQGRPFRFHDRIVYEREGDDGAWRIFRLWP